MTRESTRNRLLAIIATIMVLGAMRIGYPVIMPIVVALFIIAAAWPIKERFDRWAPPLASYVGTIAVLLLIFGGFLGIVYFAIVQVVQSFYGQQDAFRALYNSYAGWARSNGLPVIGGSGGFDRLVGLGRFFLSDVYTVLSYLSLITVIVVMGFPEVPKMAGKFREDFQKRDHWELSEAVSAIAASFRSYIRVTIVTSVITGVTTAIWAFSIGLDLALIWGVLNFLLNFVPVIGNLVGILPPTLYAFIQYDGLTMPIVVFVGFIALQTLISNFVYPMLQARGVSMPPVTIIIALLFWSWLWGFAGALLAVPLTVALVIVCRQFPNTESFAAILTWDESE